MVLLQIQGVETKLLRDLSNRDTKSPMMRTKSEVHRIYSSGLKILSHAVIIIIRKYFATLKLHNY